MKYNQPFDQPAVPNAPYVDGNPGAGIEGSIPPAASIEYPQREIVEVINYANTHGFTDQDGNPCLAPSNSDLTQLRKALGGFIGGAGIPYVADTSSTANTITAPFSPAITLLAAGKLILVKLNNTLTGPCVINVNALPTKNVRRLNGTATMLNDAFSGEMLLLSYDGAQWQIVNMLGIPAAPILTTVQTFYVNTSTGLDTNDGRAATTGGGHGPFKTIQRGINETALYNMNGHDQTIVVANGTYGERVSLTQTNGTGTVHIIGNTGSPDSCIIQGPSGRGGVYQNGGSYHIDGFKIIAGSPPAVSGDAMDCIAVDNGRLITGTLTFGTAQRAHLICGYSSQIIVGAGTIKIAGSAWAHVAASLGATLTFPVPVPAEWPNLNISSACTFTGAFAIAQLGATCQIKYNSIAGFGNASGKKFHADTNGNVTTNASGVDYLPGTIAGDTASGGQYS